MIKSALRRSLFLTSLVAFATAITLQPYRVVRVTGRSMEPSYHDGTFALAETSPVDLAHGDVVVIDTDEGPIVKRIVQLPGDRILEARLPIGIWREVGIPADGKFDTKMPLRWSHVPNGFIFVLGDNLALSRDSRVMGLVSISKVRLRLLDSPKGPNLPPSAWLPVLTTASERASGYARRAVQLPIGLAPSGLIAGLSTTRADSQNGLPTAALRADDEGRRGL